MGRRKKSERERSDWQRHRADDKLATVVVKQGCLSPEPVTHLRPDVPASNPSSLGAEAGCGGHRLQGSSPGSEAVPIQKEKQVLREKQVSTE